MAIQYLDDHPSQSGGNTIQYLDDGSSAPIQPTMMQKFGKVMTSLQPAFNAAKTLTGIVTPGSGIPELAQDLAPKIASKEGEMIAQKGTDVGYPLTGATIGTGVSMIPQIAGAFTGFKGLNESEVPLIKGMMNTPQELSPEYDALHEMAGISKNLPETGGRVARFPNMAGQPSSSPPPFAPAIAPTSYPRDPNALINFVRARIEGLGDQLSPQELNDQKTLLSQLMDTGKLGQGKPFAMAADLKNKAATLLNNRVSGLSDLNKAWAVSKTIQNPMQMLPQAIVDLVKQYGPWIASAASAIGIGRHL